MVASARHEEVLHRKAAELEAVGWRIIILTKMPDAIAIRGRQIAAVEVLKKYKTQRHKPGHGRYKTKFSGGWTLAGKRRQYSMFDEVIFAFWTETATERAITKVKVPPLIRKFGPLR